MKPFYGTIQWLQTAYQNGWITAEETTESYFRRIAEKDAAIGAYLTLCRPQALAQAKAADALLLQGERRPLLGIPMAVKDNIITKGVRTTCASHMLEHFIPPYSASVLEKLPHSPLLGKVNLDEFAMGCSTETSAFQTTKNPRNLSRTPGGSSGGAAAAVAADLAPFALGSDTGGSVRQPASFCGVVGMLPTYGRVSRYGLVAYASSLEQIGPITKTVADSAIVLSAISGFDPKDGTSCLKKEEAMGRQIGKEIKGMKLAIPKECMGKGLQPEIKAALLAAAKKLEGQGAILEEISLPCLEKALSAYYILACAEASSNLARFDGIRYGLRGQGETMEELRKHSRSQGFGAETKRRILLGTFVLSKGFSGEYYEKAVQMRQKITREFTALFQQYDALLLPTTPETAFPLGKIVKEPMGQFLADCYTVPANLAGIPAISLPWGQDEKGLPIGLQLMGPADSEPRLYQIGFVLEQEAPQKTEEGNAHV